MRGSGRSRRDKGKGNGLRFRCVRCKKLRKEDRIDRNQGGECHASPPSKGLVCGWCLLRESGATTFTGERAGGREVTRDVATGRVLR